MPAPVRGIVHNASGRSRPKAASRSSSESWRLEAGTQFLVLAPLIKGQKGEYRDLFVDLLKQGFARARVDGRVVQLTDDLRLDRQMRHQIEVVVDRLTAGSAVRARLAEAVELALRLAAGRSWSPPCGNRRRKRLRPTPKPNRPRPRLGAKRAASGRRRKRPAIWSFRPTTPARIAG